MSIEQKVEIAVQRLDAVVKLYNPVEVFGLYSGGHDSFSACVIASLHPKFSGAIHINTGIGIEFTREHVRKTSLERGWKLREYHAMDNMNKHGLPDPMDYDKLVIGFGFPGPSGHGVMYTRLKERQLRRLERDCGCCGRKRIRVLYVSGQRSQESTRRMGHMSDNPNFSTEPRRVWCSPIHDWSKQDTSDLIAHVKAERNLVVDLIHKSGECLCGAFAKKGELAELALWPQTRPAYERIVTLQKKVRANGFPWGWEDRPPQEFLEEKAGQIFIPEMKQHLCWKCNQANLA